MSRDLQLCDCSSYFSMGPFCSLAAISQKVPLAWYRLNLFHSFISSAPKLPDIILLNRHGRPLLPWVSFKRVERQKRMLLYHVRHQQGLSASTLQASLIFRPFPCVI